MFGNLFEAKFLYPDEVFKQRYDSDKRKFIVTTLGYKKPESLPTIEANAPATNTADLGAVEGGAAPVVITNNNNNSNKMFQFNHKDLINNQINNFNQNNQWKEKILINYLK